LAAACWLSARPNLEEQGGIVVPMLLAQGQNTLNPAGIIARTPHAVISAVLTASGL
jgi:hypothetical protein